MGILRVCVLLQTVVKMCWKWMGGGGGGARWEKGMIIFSVKDTVLYPPSPHHWTLCFVPPLPFPRKEFSEKKGKKKRVVRASPVLNHRQKERAKVCCLRKMVPCGGVFQQGLQQHYSFISYQYVYQMYNSLWHSKVTSHT